MNARLKPLHLLRDQVDHGHAVRSLAAFRGPFLVTVVLTLAWAVVGCLLGFDRWLQLPAHWSWHKDADWEGQI